MDSRVEAGLALLVVIRSLLVHNVLQGRGTRVFVHPLVWLARGHPRGEAAGLALVAALGLDARCAAQVL